jgi:hypothetical protein
MWRSTPSRRHSRLASEFTALAPTESSEKGRIPMPFDVTVRLDRVGLSAQELLESAASASDLAILDLRFLEAHKAEQVRRNPPGWIYRHALGIQLCQPLLLLVGLSGFGALGAIGCLTAGMAVAVLAFALAIAPFVVTSPGPARWRERGDPDLRGVHPEVRAAALRLKGNLPQARFVVGDLYQDRTKLDPYLVADYRGARILLGIWDGDTLILCA